MLLRSEAAPQYITKQKEAKITYAFSSSISEERKSQPAYNQTIRLHYKS